jgi:6,7-dimethyl-8-ribityllumazine synthase
MNQSDQLATLQGESPPRSPLAVFGARAGLRVAFIHGCWHQEVVNQARDAFLAEMKRQGVPSDAIDVIEVPGAFEIPLHAQRFARSGRYQAVVACAFVVDGGIYRHEFVAQAVIDGLMRVQLDTDVPVISTVLTPHQFHDHEEHRQRFAAHFVTKGIEAANACIQTVQSLRRLRELSSV